MTEDQEQIALFEWATSASGRYPELRLMFHVPNEGKKTIGEAMKQKRKGVKAGVPDIFLPVPMQGYHGLFIEMKRADGGRLTKEQVEYLSELKRQGYFAVVCKGFFEAKYTILDYLRGNI